MDRYGNLYGSNTPYMEEMFIKFQADPNSVDQEWRTFFESINNGYEMVVRSKGGTAVGNQTSSTASVGTATDQDKVSRLVQGYRARGHKCSYINPLAPKPELASDLQLSTFDLNETKLNDTFATDGVLPSDKATLKDIIAALQHTYTNHIGVQYSQLHSTEERVWLRRKMEAIQNTPSYTKEEKQRMLEGLMVSEKFEQFIHTKYIGMKRFSIEGGESMIPMLDTMFDHAGKDGVEDVVMGMAHRGRLNVLVNILQKPFKHIFAGFNDTLKMDQVGSGDVKYHMGKSYDIETRSGNKIHVSLQNNPSHLEAVNPVVEGSVRAKQDKKGENGHKKVLPLLIHGDAAFSGQGIVPETLNLANLKGYGTGGTIHLVINNQVGFTANPEDAFSGEYCTDMALLLQVPVFHVNADDVEACNHVMELATAWRNEFHKDVVIDMVCYRRYGHNEGDDPTFTQPTMYKSIKAQDTVYTKYRERLLNEGNASQEEVNSIETTYHEKLQTAYDLAKQRHTEAEADIFGAHWSEFSRHHDEEPKTAITKKLLSEVADCFVNMPSDFEGNRKVLKGQTKRTEMLKSGPMDWGAAEVAAYGSLLNEGYSVRISGQDVQRGTFSHRHITIVDQNDGHEHTPIQTMCSKGSTIEVHNSPVTELAVLGFEFGYTLADPRTLTIWEAQFGDFANGAQMLFDQFISCSENKWHRMSGLVVLLPHGFEGQGPEHSSARLERFLQLSAEDNWTVANVTTPAQIFHLLRRQMHRKARRPLIVMTPKSLLRHPKAISTPEDLTGGEFSTVLPDPHMKATDVTRVTLCAGKVYYDLLAEQEEGKHKHVALVRMEQLYPLDEKSIKKVVGQYKKAKDFVWVQEEPRNQGAWTFILDNMTQVLDEHIQYIGRAASASPAVGSMKIHKEQQEAIVKKVFAK